MEPQVSICCNNKKNNKRNWCAWLIIGILSVALAFTLGLLIGALTSILVLLSLPAIIVLIVILIILLIIEIIMLLCQKEKKNCCN